MVSLFDEDSGLYYEDREDRLKRIEEFDVCETSFDFVNDHYSFKKEKLHLLIGTTGSGKSTLTRSLLMDIAKHHKVLFWSTEETKEETLDMLSVRGVQGEFLKNIRFLEEDILINEANLSLKDVPELIRIIATEVINNGAEIIFFDNITTSQFYQSYETQLLLVNSLRTLIKNLKIPLLIVAHTRKDVKDDQKDLIGPNDIMGPKTLADKAQYTYVYQKIVIPGMSADATQGVVRVVKGRGKANIGNIYFLRYDFDKHEYTSDYKVLFNDFNKLYKERAKLKDK
jgi:KaiC/GvpD/RAD55 family RecA-like ATPase